VSSRLERFLAGVRDPTQRKRSPHALQRPELFFAGLGARPWHDAREHTWTASLEASFGAIRDELVALWRRVPPGMHPAHEQLVTAGAWRAHPLHARGRRFDEALELCPATARAIERVPGRTPAGLVYVSVLEPNTRVRSHCGPTNLRLRCHLPLVVPRGARVRVGREWRSWTEGECLLFDDSFEHEAENRASEPRLVLIVDVWHPDLTQGERRGLERAWAHIAPSEGRATTGPVGPVGALAAFVAEPARRRRRT
jgi:aspartyl/asparaginyl beta-hydroxylase (cupin superfamily)